VGRGETEAVLDLLEGLRLHLVSSPSCLACWRAAWNRKAISVPQPCFTGIYCIGLRTSLLPTSPGLLSAMCTP